MEHVVVVDATGGQKTVTFAEGAWEVSGRITNDDTLAMSLQHRPSDAEPPAPVELPAGVGYARPFKAADKHIIAMGELAVTVPAGAVAVFQCEAEIGYPAPVVQ